MSPIVGPPRRRAVTRGLRLGLGVLLLAVVGSLSVPAVSAQAVSAQAASSRTVIVRSEPGALAGAEAAVERLGGRVLRPMEIIHGFTALVPASSVDELSGSAGVHSVTPDGSLRLLGDDWSDGWVADTDLGSLYTVTKAVGADDAWSRSDAAGDKITGGGVGVALIDSGVVPVEGLTQPGKVVNGPDLSFESQDPELRYLDTYGHGTHMAGIIAGRDTAVEPGDEDDSEHFVGVAPDATLVNVKVASADGATDVSQVIAALDWVVAHRDDPGLNIRVVNLSFGTDSTQSYLLDPLAYAAEVAWHHGIVVVVAAGNGGIDAAGLTNPAIDPYLVAVGASDHRGTEDRDDDTVADFSSRGNEQRHPDLVAPGRSIVSLRNPGSFIDQHNPGGLVADDPALRYFRGSGTSQATAVVAGAAALLLDERPWLTPDQVKDILTSSAESLPESDAWAQGAGQLDIKEALHTPEGTSTQDHPQATGTGSLEAARGSEHVADPVTGAELVGEIDIFGQPWDGRRWSQEAWEGRSWRGGIWNGSDWVGSDWSGTSWTGRTWRAADWAGTSWTGRTWRDYAWSAGSWTADGWAGRTWRDALWAGRTWRHDNWS